MNGQRRIDLLWQGFSLLVLIFMITPILLVIVFSFNRSALTSLPLTGFTFDWYAKLFDNRSFRPALQNSLIVGCGVALASVVIGTMAALALARLPVRQAGGIIATLSLPMMMPALIIGVSLICFFLRFLDLRLSLVTVTLGQLVIAQPFVILIVYARMASFDHAVIDSARDLGASAWTAFRTVTLPIIRPTIVGAGLIALSISLDDFVITFFTIGGGSTLPIYMMGLMRRGVNPQINVASLVLVTMTIGASLIALRATRYRG
jgi:spermidine/putrescine transport system permease protein